MQINRFYLYPISFVVGLWLSSCSTKQDSGSTSIKFQQYYVQGEQLFIQHCSNCHQKDGKGLGLLYPPVNQSDFIEENFEKVICIIRNGIKGDIVVNGNTYNKEMPPMPALTDLEIAEITTYLYNTWGREKGIIEVKDASQILTNCVE
jgi:mono/diheme cytochrome c family protein